MIQGKIVSVAQWGMMLNAEKNRNQYKFIEDYGQDVLPIIRESNHPISVATVQSHCIKLLYKLNSYKIELWIVRNFYARAF